MFVQECKLRPTRSSEGVDVSDIIEKLAKNKSNYSIPLNKVAQFLKDSGFFDVSLDSYQPYLRHFHVKHNDLDVYMFFNEHPFETIQTLVTLQGSGKTQMYDAFTNYILEPDDIENKTGNTMSLSLSPYESIIVLQVEGVEGIHVSNRQNLFVRNSKNEMKLEGPWKISIATSKEYPLFHEWVGCNL
ncbi:hypothetical protein [Neobacillus vireti]|uniref:hypothetical protein n=1 Tax=Neobacillus vireti TaxID=220686 RepID=UPI00300028C6